MNETSIEIHAFLRRAGSEINAAKARGYLLQAKALAENLPDELGADGNLLRAEVFAECAFEENRPRLRSDLWRRCLKACHAAWRQDKSIRAADQTAIFGVDCFQDTLSDLEQGDKHKILANAKNVIEEALRLPITSNIKATLLARKSSIMRHQSIGQFTWPQKRQILGECVRCTELARKLSSDFGVLVESGQACWIYARHEEDDDKYAARLREAERFLTEPAVSGDDFARLTLARFYRLNFDPLGACQMFPRELTLTGKLRKHLRDSYIFGEAVIQLWYQEYPDQILRPLLQEAKMFLETALAAGYNIARIAIALAYITALLDGTREGEGILAEMFGDPSANPWSRALEIASQPILSTPLTEGLALGIDQSEIWQSLGSYARRLLNDNNLAEQFYRRALALNDRNAVALTNLGRVLIERSEYQEARRCLDKARTFSDRRFFWWKTVLDELALRELGVPAPLSPLDVTLQPLSHSLRSLPEVCKRFEALLRAQDHQARGYLLEELFIELARLNYSIASARYQLTSPGGSRAGLDGYFEHRGVSFRVECKWESVEATKGQIVEFADKLDVANVHGLFLSMSGFASSAVEKARERCREHPMILMDGSEAELVFRGRARLDAVISKKLSHLMHSSEPYSPVTAEHFG